MKKTLTLLAALTLFCLSLGAQQTIVMGAKSEPDCKAFVAKNFHKGVIPPFSFEYGGVHSSKFIRKWKFSSQTLQPERPNETLSLYTWTDPVSALQVSCRVKTFTDYNAMEWVLGFKNCGSANSAQITSVKVVDLLQKCSVKGAGFVLHYADGSDASKHDFHAMKKEFAPGDDFTMAPLGGRSSYSAFPFFNMQIAGGGLIYAIGWTGTWIADIKRTDGDSVNISTGMKFLDTYLEAGEEIRTPSTAILAWTGSDRMTGQNKFRHFILDHHHPLLGNGQRAQYPVCNSFNYGDPAPCNEYTCLTATYAKALIHRYQQFSLVPDVFWLDAGWYKEAAKWQEGRNWGNTVGCWEVDTDRFPNGLGEIADEVHKAGAKFMVWFEPERVHCSSYWCRDHSDYLLNHIEGEPAPYCEGDTSWNSHIVDLGNPEALKWMTDNIIKLIRDNKIDYYRQDYNLDPEGFFYVNDKPGRRGITEIGYITGLYKFWDALRAEFPDLIIDNCASGGRRLDLETTSRSAPLWRTDYNYGEPVGYQCHTYGLNQWLPVHGTGVGNSDNYTYRSSFSYCVTHNWKITSKDFNIIQMQKKLAEFYAVRPYFLEDFYPLTDAEDITGNDIWIAYQLNRPSDCTGYLVAFRRADCKESSRTIRFRGLDSGRTYVLEDQDSGSVVELSAESLAEGYELRSEQCPGSVLIRYYAK